MDYKVNGTDMQSIEVVLNPGESIRAEVGTMLYMGQGIEMQTNVEGGMWKGMKRSFMGESFFITTFLNSGSAASSVEFAAPFPGKIMKIDLAKFDGEFICEKDAFICSTSDVDVDIAFTKKFGAGLFGGEGFILQKLSGSGVAFIHLGGTAIQKQLKAGESLRVDTGCLAAFSKDVTYDIKFVGGFKNTMFGGEGIFLAHLSGPGVVLLQSIPFSRLADKIISSAGPLGNKQENDSIGTAMAGAAATGLLRSVMKGLKK